MTKFRFGGRSVPGQHAGYPGRPHGVVPSNAGIAHSAQESIDLLTAAASRRIAEAVSIDSVQLFVFSPKHHGIRCGCETIPTTDVKKEASSNPYLLGVDEDKTDSLETASGSTLRVKVRDVTADDHHYMHSNNNRPDHNFSEADIFGDEAIPPKTSTSGTTDPYTDNSTSTGPYEGPMHNGRHAGEFDHERSTDGFDESGEELIDEYDNDAWNPDNILADNAWVIGSSQTCPICFGYGLLGGYNLIGGTRLVLSSVNATEAPPLGADDSVLPPVFTLEPDEYVEWANLHCPNYFKLAWAIALDGKHASDVVITYSLDGVNYAPIAGLDSVSQQNLATLTVRATNTTEDQLKVTHLDITLIHNAVRGQLTNFNQTANHSSIISGDGVEVTFPPELGKIDRNALIGDGKHKLMWRVTTVTPVETAKGQVISCSAMTELLKPSFMEALLYPLYSVKGNKQLIFGAGVEPVQGMR